MMHVTLLLLIIQESISVSEQYPNMRVNIITNDIFQPVDKHTYITDTIFKFLEKTPIIINCITSSEKQSNKIIKLLESEKVKFEGCRGYKSGAIEVNHAEINCRECYFINCYGEYAGAVYSFGSILSLEEIMNVNCTSSKDNGEALLFSLKASDSISKIDTTHSIYSDTSEIIKAPLIRVKQLPITIKQMTSNTSISNSGITIYQSMFFEISDSFFNDSSNIHNALIFNDVSTVIIMSSYFGFNQHLIIKSTQAAITNCTFKIPINEAIKSDGKNKLSLSSIKMTYSNESISVEIPYFEPNNSNVSIAILIFCSFILCLCLVVLFFFTKTKTDAQNRYNELPGIDDDTSSSFIQ